MQAFNEADPFHELRARSDLSISDFADYTHMSARQLNRFYQNKLGITPKTYANIIRFIEAKTLLEQDFEMSLLEIAGRCNYYDQSHFIKSFKKYTGLTPVEFKERIHL